MSNSKITLHNFKGLIFILTSCCVWRRWGIFFIPKMTHTIHSCYVTLYSVQLELIQSIVGEVNKKTGEAECQFYRRGLSYLEESQRLPEIQQSRFLYCHGELKNNKGQVAVLIVID